MNPISTVTWVTAAFVLSLIAPAQQYCSATHSATSCSADEYISRVQIAAVDQASICVGPPSYEDYTSSTINLTPSVAAPIIVTVSRYVTSDSVTVFVDWNADGDFIDSGEAIPLTLQPGSGATRIFTGNVTAPPGAAANTRLRVRLVFEGCCPGGPATPCGVFGFGDTEDYAVHVNAAPSLQVAPAASPASVPQGGATLITATVTATAPPNPPTGLQVSINLGPVGGLATQPLFDDGTHGDVVAGDRVFSFLWSAPGSLAAGVYNLVVTATDGAARTAQGVLTLPVQLANDECTGAIPIVEGVNPPTGFFTNVGATLTNSLTFATYCGAFGNPGGSDVFFVYNALCDGSADVATCPPGAVGGTLTDSQITVYPGAGCPTSGAVAGCADDSACGPNGFLTTVNFQTLAGQSYLVRVAGYGGQQGTFQLTITRHSAGLTVLGTGCTAVGPGGPTLTATLPVLGTPGTVAVAGGAASAPLVIYLSAAPAPTTVISGGCSVYLDFATFGVFVQVSLDPAGGWSFTSTLPSSPQLECLMLRLQGIVLPASANPPYQLTNGLELRFGY